MVLSQDFSEFVKLLNANQVRYLVVGGYAVAFHGHPRYTKDLDIWIENSQSNAARMLAALEQFGFASLDLRLQDFVEPNQVIQLGYPPSRIDILTSLKGISFEACYDLRVTVPIAGLNVDFIDLGNLRQNKMAVGRIQDLADLENLAP